MRVRMMSSIVTLLVVGCDAATPLTVREADSVPAGGLQPAAVEVHRREYVAVAVPRRSVDVASRVGGRLVELPRALGAPVVAGDVVATLADPELDHLVRSAEAAVLEAVADHERATAEAAAAARIEIQTIRLGAHASEDERAIAATASRRAQAERRSAAARVTEARAEVERLRARVDALTLRSEFDGRIGIQHHQPGMLVHEQTPIVRVVSDDFVVRFAVPVSELAAVPPGAVVEYRDDALGVIPVTVSMVSPEVDASALVVVETAPTRVSTGRVGGSGLVVPVRSPVEEVQ